MLVLVVFLLVLFSSAAVIREKKAGQAHKRPLDPPPIVFVQPARSDSVRHFMKGQVSLMKVQDQGSLMFVENQEMQNRDADLYFLKSEEPFLFQTTLVTKDSKGQVSVHASLQKDRKVIVFRV